mmetsp:Transcript_7490/g.12029  ORF Transcript_7490/g.12029 Transcript_7490/m.12029 type:complete len:308 (-) Transcript_7490:646-1569(-)|eukprot:CAMPEP_0203761898 /NCGR_PEP_ID=MMETSP0098-20131031/14893_1 /ASSEMBLY_ACC=CAM_ASM_000208 /TAXON_ID=96639 /ORGANISM=" , Strain NY0313808BC1" /LENGTH=307 /DNA_ID=CAMNT_0050656081 /DNA_START=207 /DNA_END=1130 /DNA_ORIENTATION=-
MTIQQLAGRIQGARETRARHEIPESLVAARDKVPVETLCSRAGVAIEPEGRSGVDWDRLLVELMRWFKGEFFEWVNGLKCFQCGKECTPNGTSAPSPYEAEHLASVVEIHECADCQLSLRFPRYNCPAKLLETRKGRCGEWANCFCLIAVALGFRVRYVIDFTDHVWCEIFSKALNRFVHCDPCEGADTLDSPLMYEVGWGKQLTYIFGIDVDHIVDLSQKYTRDYQTMLTRRTMALEQEVFQTVERLHVAQSSSSRPSRETLDLLLREQFSMLDWSSADRELKETELQGRISGDEQWKRLRGELNE